MIVTILSGWLFAEKRTLAQLSLESVKKLWEDWEVQILILFSLFLQISLIVMGNRRKYNPGTWLRLCIWSAYLLADWVATVALGVLFKKQRNACGGATDKINLIDYELMAFWAPFLLLHLGGPDTITAYAIADNELWIRHLLGLCVQTGVALYVTYTAWSGTWLSFLTIPMLFAGVIKYGERSLALMSANREQFLVSLLDSPDPGPNYAKFMEEFSSKKEEGFSVSADEVVEVSHQSDARSNEGNNSSADSTRQLLTDADKFFKNFKRLFVDLILSFQDRDSSQSFFQNSTWEDAFTLVEMELGFGYDAFYTKAPILYTVSGCVCRFLTSSFTIIVFVFFLIAEKHNHLQTDLIVTYILLVGAILLEFYAVILLLSSDRTELWLSKPENFTGNNRCFQLLSQIISCFKSIVSRITSCFQRMVSPVTYFFHQPKVSPIISYFGNIVFNLIFYFLPYNKKRWSNSMSQYNLLTFSLKRNLVPFLDHKRVQKIVKHLPFHGTLEKCRYEYRCKISSHMKILIFQHFLNKSKVSSSKGKAEVNEVDKEKAEVNKEKAKVSKEKADINKEKAKANKEKSEYDKYIASLCSARGGLVFQEEEYECSSSFDWSTEQVEFDQSILIWHIATELCYHSDMDEDLDAKDSSKNLSDYMLHLLVMCPFMLPIGIGMMRFRDTCEEAKAFAKEKGLSSKHNDKFRTMLLAVCTEVEPTKVKGDRSKSVLFDGCRLANQLQKMVEENKWNEEKKWKFICNVWIEILGYAASHCRGYFHAQQLANGGELLTHVWLLMAHLGITGQFQINRGHARAKLAVE